MIYIDSQIEFDKLCNKLTSEAAIAFDCEFIRETTFVPLLCLMQIATKKHIYIIDPLKLNLKLFLEILLDDNILKIMHSSLQDIDVFYKNFEVIPKSIFDTQLAASFLGFGDSISYAKLVKKVTKTSLCKENKLANWQKRPLTNAELTYAGNDVKYLFELYEKLNADLLKLKRQNWFQEEIENLYNLENYYLDPDIAWKRVSQNSEIEFFLNYLRAFTKYRENLAVSKNKPRRFIIRDEFLIRLAKLKPIKMEDFEKDRILKKMTPKYMLEDLLVIAKKTKLEKTELVVAKKEKLNDKKELIADYLKIYLKYVAKESKVSVKNIALTKDIERFIRSAQVPFMTGWRYEIFGKIAKKILTGEIALIIKNDKLELKEI
ncbi:MAG: hypothetical protein HOH73_02880 [Alphaproteobacteria bacterium]|jgi:ribonuclease D|nr:hypothetical protein [Alphaproteobacteria bacterium]